MSLALCFLLFFQGPALRPNGLVKQIEQITTDAAFAGSFWGISVYAPLRGKTLYSRWPNHNFRPASNMKILTTLLAMEYLGPNYVFQTRVNGTATLQSGHLEGDLVVIGGGDPSMSGNYSEGAYSTKQLMDILIRDLKQQGLSSVSGDLVADLSFFDDRRIQNSWEWDDMGNYYATPITPLSLNDGQFDLTFKVDENGTFSSQVIPFEPPDLQLNLNLSFEASASDWRRARIWGTNHFNISGNMPPCYQRTSSVSAWDPPAQFMAYFHQALREAGIQISGDIRFSKDPVPANYPLAVYESEPLSILAQTLMKESQNHYADAFLKTTAALVKGDGSFEAGSDLAIEFVTRLMPNSGALINVRDGSGLSAQNNLQPGVLIALLRYGWQQPYRQQWLETFPIMGVDGTLSRRGRAAPGTNGFVWAKTGYIFRTRCLSGYVETEFGEPLIFSIMVNNYACPTALVNEAQDRLCAAMRRLKPNRTVRSQKDQLFQLSKIAPAK